MFIQINECRVRCTLNNNRHSIRILEEDLTRLTLSLFCRRQEWSLGERGDKVTTRLTETVSFFEFPVHV